MSLSRSLIDELLQEANTTRTVLQRVPEDALAWTPHPRSRTLGQLAMHIAGVPRGIAELLDPLVSEVPNVPDLAPRSREEILALHDASVAFAAGRLAAWGDEGLRAMWRMTIGGETAIEQPRVAMVRALMLSHVFHHRGQLSVYLRLRDVPVPPIYGPTADENPFG